MTIGRRFAGSLAVWGIALCCAAAIIAATSTPLSAAEFRAFWIDAWGTGILSQAQVDTLLGVPGTSTKGQIRDANCNAVVVQVRRNCDANYPSSMGEPYMSGLSPSNFNALQAVINAAHDTTGGKKRIEVHAWIVTFRTSGGAVYSQHDDTPTGSLTSLDNYWIGRLSTGSEVSDKSFDPGHPLAEEYTVNVAMDLVTNFDIDGIHYDYIRFGANNEGYNPTSIARYNQLYGLTGQPSYTTEQFRQWRRDQVSAFVRKMYARIQAVKPWVRQTIAGVTWSPAPSAATRSGFQGTRPYYEVYSDWDSWLQEGIVDAAMPMTYYDLAGSYTADWTKWINFQKDRHGSRHIYIGPGIYLNSLSNSITQLQQTRTASPSGNYAQGFCGYSYRVPYVSGSWSGFSPSLVSSVTSTWDDIPAMPWKASPTKGHISGTVTIASTGAWSDGVFGTTVSITGPETRSLRCDGTGFYAFIDLTPGTYTVTASRSGYPSSVATVVVALGAVTGNMYVRDFALGATAAPPVISNVQAISVTGSAATITWSTDVPSDSQVQYGLTSSYGLSSTLDTSVVTSHSVTLSGLSPSTTYHYRVRSANAVGTTYSPDYTFTTTDGSAVPDIIVESRSGGQNYAWYSESGTLADSSAKSTAADCTVGIGSRYGSTYRSAAGEKHALFAATIPQAGNYEVFATWGGGSSRRSPVRHTITHAGGTTDVDVDQTATSNEWVSLGAYLFAAGSGAASVDINNLATDVSGSFYADAVKWVWKNPAPSGPAISSVQASGVTNSSASITWNTDQAATSQVKYGTSTAYLSTTTLDPNLVTSHSQTLTGLASKTLYHYCVVSTNANGTSTSADYTFTTSGPPVVSGAQATGITASSATITWTTDAPADSVVSYGPTSSYGSQSADAPLVTSHTISLTGLTAGTTYHYRCTSSNAYGSGSSTDLTFVTSSPPAISGVSATGVTATSATITWSTDQPADSTVNYGTTASYGSTASGATGVTSHSVQLTGLAPCTTYHFRCVSANANGTATSGDYTFATGPAPAEIIIDNSDPASTSSGTWILVTESGYNGDFRWASNRRTSQNAAWTWTPTIVSPGYYSVYCRYPLTTTPTANATYTVTHSGGTTSASFNQASGVDTWNLIASSVWFDAGTAGKIVLNNLTGETNSTKRVVADAVKLVYLGTSLPPADVIVDDRDASAVFTGSWTEGSYAGGYQTYYKWANNVAASATGSCAWTPDLAATGLYDVYCWYNSGTNRTTSANYVVNYSGGSTSATVNQTSGGGAWVLLASGLPFSAGTGGSVVLSNATGEADASTVVIADAIRWVYAGASTGGCGDSSPPTVTISAPSVALTRSGPVSYTIAYSDDTSVSAISLGAPHVTLNTTGTATGSVSVSGSGTAVRTVTVSGITGNGAIGISIAAGTAQDAAGNAALPAGPSATFTVDNTAPTISIGSPSASSTRSGPVSYIVTYSGADGVTLSASEITLNKSGTANGSVSVSGSGVSARTVTVSGITGDGTLGISIAAGTASDAAGNPAPASGPSATFAVDNTAPTVAISSPSVALTRSGPVIYTVTYSGAASVTLATANITLNKTGTADGTIVVSGSGTTSRSVTISGITGDGTLSISVAAGTASDTAGNTAAGAGPSADFTVDNTAPQTSAVPPGGLYDSDRNVTLSTGEASVIYFTTDGTTPTTASAQYSSALSITTNTTLRFFAVDAAGNQEAVKSEVYVIDKDAPGAVIVTDEGSWTPSLTTLKASWTAASDGAGSGIAGYDYAVGTSAGTQDTRDWTPAGNVTSISDSSLALAEAQQYFVQVRARDNVGHTGPAAASDGIRVAPGVNPLGDLWTRPDSVGLALRDKVVTRALPGQFWLEEADRSAAVKVLAGASVAQGDRVSVAGVLGISAGQRVLIADVVEPRGSAAIPLPVGMMMYSLGGAAANPLTPGATDSIALYNVGLLVRVWGTVTGSDTGTPGSYHFYLDDGTGLSDGGPARGVRVLCGSIAPPASGLVTVQGVVGLEISGAKLVPVVVVTGAGDIAPL